MGYSPGARRFVASTVKRITKATPTLSRRQAEQGVLKRSFEALAHARSELTGGRKHTNRYYTAVRAYAAKTNQRVGDARRDATFQELYRKQLRSKDRSVKNRALLDLGLRQKDWWWREGETPTIRLYFGTIDQAGRATAAQRADYAAFQLERGKT